MTELDKLIAKAYASEGKTDDVNKVYLALLREKLFIPVEKNTSSTSPAEDEEPFTPLFAKENNLVFMAVFDTLDRLKSWAGEHMDAMDYVELKGKDLIAGIGNEVYLSLNIGADYYKEFSPDEIKRLKTIVAKINTLQ